MVRQWTVRIAVALILITSLVLILPFGEGAPAGLLERTVSFVTAFATAGIILLVRLRARRGSIVRDDKLFDERARFILEKTARITYAVFYLSALALANVLFIISRFGLRELRYPAATLYICVAFIALVHRLTFEFLRRRYG